MKIKISTTIPAIALALTVLTGCGGSGVATQQSNGFPNGIYVSTFDGRTVTYFTDLLGSNLRKEAADSPVLCQAFNKKGQLLMGTQKDQIVLVPSPGSSNRQVFGSSGDGPMQFHDPRKIAFDSQGRIYVADMGNRRIARFDDMAGKNWTTIDLTPYLAVTGDGPSSVALDASDRMYVSLEISGKLLRFSNFTDLSPASYGSDGGGVGQFQFLTDVHVCPDGQLLLADSGNSRIVRIDQIGGSGWTTLGTAGGGPNQFMSPNTVTSDSAGRIYVSDLENWRVCRFDDMTGTGWTTYGSYGGGTGQFPDLSDITIRE